MTASIPEGPRDDEVRSCDLTFPHAHGGNGIIWSSPSVAVGDGPENTTVGLPEGWTLEPGVLCVVCPECAFTFDANHTDPDGSWSCPLCAPSPPVEPPSDRPAQVAAVAEAAFAAGRAAGLREAREAIVAEHLARPFKFRQARDNDVRNEAFGHALAAVEAMEGRHE